MSRQANRQNTSTPKNIVICSDGTGNHDIKARGTNVFKLYEAVDIHGYATNPACPRQVAIYDSGVGTRGPMPWRAFCGAVGYGFSANIRHLYRSLLEVYEQDDAIYLFGFSRGAYTVRALAGLIGKSLANDARKLRENPATDMDVLVSDSWTSFKKRAMADEEDSHDSSNAPRLVKFLGVWDTVGAVGFPLVDLTRRRYRFVRWAFWWVPWFGDNRPCRTVERACQALALDDQRATFRPELWNEERVQDRAPRIQQVWFAGAHANVGGGYPRQGISLVALDWMMREAESAGLHFIESDRENAHVHRDVHDKLYDSRGGVGVYYRWQPRRVVALCREQKIDSLPMVHESVLQRISRGTEGYAPINVPLPCRVVYTNPPDSQSPVTTKDFSPPWEVEHFDLPEEARPTLGERLRAFITDYFMLQFGLGALVGVFLHNQLLDELKPAQLGVAATLAENPAGSEVAVVVAVIVAVAAAVSTMFGLSLLRLLWAGLDAVLRWIPAYKSFREFDDELERNSPYNCLSQVLGSHIAAGKRAYFLFLLTTLFGAGVAISAHTVAQLDRYHALAATGILVIMAYCAWAAGASVDKRIAKVANAFWSKDKRDEIQSKLFAWPAPRGEEGRKSQSRLSDLAHGRRGQGDSSVLESEAGAE